MKGVWKENVWVWNQKHMYVKGEYVCESTRMSYGLNGPS